VGTSFIPAAPGPNFTSGRERVSFDPSQFVKLEKSKASGYSILPAFCASSSGANRKRNPTLLTPANNPKLGWISPLFLCDNGCLRKAAQGIPRIEHCPLYFYFVQLRSDGSRHVFIHGAGHDRFVRRDGPSDWRVHPRFSQSAPANPATKIANTATTYSAASNPARCPSDATSQLELIQREAI
jgi:hypothetical protein